MFELYNLTGNGDLNVQTNGLPLAPPFFQTSQNRGVSPGESILIFTNAGFTNIDLTYYLGVPTHENNQYQLHHRRLDPNQSSISRPSPAPMAGRLARPGRRPRWHRPATVYHVTSTQRMTAVPARSATPSMPPTARWSLIVFGHHHPRLAPRHHQLLSDHRRPDGARRRHYRARRYLTAVTNAHDVIIRDVRFRRETAERFPPIPCRLQYHCRSRFGPEWTSINTVSVLQLPPMSLLQWSILAQSLFGHAHQSPGHGFAAPLLAAGTLSVNHNLYADNYNGSPRLGDNVSLDFVNNVVYDWGTNAGFSANDRIDRHGRHSPIISITTAIISSPAAMR